MRICIIVGHSRLKNGSYTSADGRPYGGVLEYKWCKNFSKDLVSALKKNGHIVKRIICPEKKFTSSSQERIYKLNAIGKERFDLIVELHLNSGKKTAEGCEVLYMSGRAKVYANKIQKALSKKYKDRGIKLRNDLYILKQTKDPCVIMETFFCTNKNEYSISKGATKRKKIAKIVADALS